MTPVKLREVVNRNNWTQPGDYWFAGNTLILSCPYCNHLSYLPHKILCKNPLTVTPSVVEHPCEHHFMVDNGWAQ